MILQHSNTPTKITLYIVCAAYLECFLTSGSPARRSTWDGSFAFLLLHQNQSFNGTRPLHMVGPRKVQSFTHKKRRWVTTRQHDLTKFKSTKARKAKREKYRKLQGEMEDKEERNDMLRKFGIDIGSAGQEIYDWLYPKDAPNIPRKLKKRMEMHRLRLELRRARMILAGEREKVAKKPIANINRNLHEHVLYNFGLLLLRYIWQKLTANETIVRAYKRIAFHMRINPRMLAREVCSITGKFGIELLQPTGYERGRDIGADILCLRRVKFKVYTLVGLKLLRYTLMFLIRYIRLGIPPEIRYRYISDLLTKQKVAAAFTLTCNQYDYKSDSPLDQTYPERISFTSQGYPYSDAPLFDESRVEKSERWSPLKLINQDLLPYLTEESKARLVYMAAAIYPRFALQIVKNIAFSAGYESERCLLTRFCLRSTFTSRGAKSFLSKLREERIADKFLRRAAKLYSRSRVQSLRRALNILKDAPLVQGLVRRHLESGRRVMPVNRARMIYKRIRRGVHLPPQEMMLWDVLRDLIIRRVLDTPLRVFKNARMEMFSVRTFLSPALAPELEKRGIDPSKLYWGTLGLPNDIDGVPREGRIRLAKKIAKNTKKIWLSEATKAGNTMESIALTMLDAIASVAGYKDLNNVLVLISLLSKPEDKVSKYTRQPGPEFEHSPRIEFKDFRFKLLD